jgi:hypothetical protein
MSSIQFTKKSFFSILITVFFANFIFPTLFTRGGGFLAEGFFELNIFLPYVLACLVSGLVVATLVTLRLSSKSIIIAVVNFGLAYIFFASLNKAGLIFSSDDGFAFLALTNSIISSIFAGVLCRIIYSSLQPNKYILPAIVIVIPIYLLAATVVTFVAVSIIVSGIR